MNVLIISAQDLTPPPGIFSAVEVARTLREGLNAAEGGRFDGVLADLTNSDHVEDDIRELDEGVDAPVMAMVRGANSGLILRGDCSVRLLDYDWVGRDMSVVYGLLARDIIAEAQAAELEELRSRQAQMVHAEKFAAVGVLAAEIAHEINNPATFVITNLTVMVDYVRTIGRFHSALHEHLRGGQSVDLEAFEALGVEHEISFLDEDLNSLLERSLAGLNRIHRIVQDLRYFGNDRRTHRGLVDLEAVISAAVGLIRHEARFRADLVVELPELPMIRSDGGRLSQVILNVVVNAVQAIVPGHPEENEVRITATLEPQSVRLTVSDTGEGMEPEVLANIFEPFFTTKSPGDGTGLGLAISRDIMRSLGGEIVANSRPGVGSNFTLVIPRDGE